MLLPEGPPGSIARCQPRGGGRVSDSFFYLFIFLVYLWIWYLVCIYYEGEFHRLLGFCLCWVFWLFGVFCKFLYFNFISFFYVILVDFLHCFIKALWSYTEISLCFIFFFMCLCLVWLIIYIKLFYSSSSCILSTTSIISFFPYLIHHLSILWVDPVNVFCGVEI